MKLPQSSDRPATGAVMVLYRPDATETLTAIRALSLQVDLMCLVDNSPSPNPQFTEGMPDNIIYVPMGGNAGIARAQNKGIETLIGKGMEFILFSDQDSEAEPGVADALLSAHKTLKDAGIKAGAVGTRPVNKTTGIPYPPKSLELGVPPELQSHANNALPITECYSVISSISLIPVQAFKDTGGFDESLFIDGVDHEWCWRAWHKGGYRSFIAENATIRHKFGEEDRKIAGTQRAISGAARTYFQFRNYLWLYSDPVTPRFWKKKNMLKYAVKSFYYPLAVAPRSQYLKNITKGIWDGLFKKRDKSWPDFQEKND